MNFLDKGECSICNKKCYIANKVELYCIDCYKDMVCPKVIRLTYESHAPFKTKFKKRKRRPRTYSLSFRYPQLQDQDRPWFENAVRILEDYNAF